MCHKDYQLANTFLMPRTMSTLNTYASHYRGCAHWIGYNFYEDFINDIFRNKFDIQYFWDWLTWKSHSNYSFSSIKGSADAFGTLLKAANIQTKGWNETQKQQIKACCHKAAIGISGSDVWDTQESFINLLEMGAKYKKSKEYQLLPKKPSRKTPLTFIRSS